MNVKMQNGPLRIVIAGVPPGVKVGVFDETKDRDNPKRTILLEEVDDPKYVVERKIDPSYSGVSVRVVIRSVGFLPIEFEDTIEPHIGLYHAAYLAIDRAYSGTPTDIPNSWKSYAEFRKAEKYIQSRLEHLFSAADKNG